MDPDESLEHYIEIGAVEVVGIDEDGEFIFKITEQAKDLAPQLWEAHQDHVDGVLLGLFEDGLLNVTYTEDLEAVIELTAEGKEVAKQYGLIEFED